MTGTLGVDDAATAPRIILTSSGMELRFDSAEQAQEAASDAAGLSAVLKRVAEIERWMPPGRHLPQQVLDPEMDPETVATIIRMTGGNFRLLNRLLTRMERILEINALAGVTKAVVEAARESLVIGQS